MSSPRSLSKVGRSRPLRVLVLGQSAVGKTALVVRCVTRRFIGDYDSTIERRYGCQLDVDGESVSFEIVDTVGQAWNGGSTNIEERVKWADAFLLVYSVCDSCSLDECTRLKFLVNHVKRSRRSHGGGATGLSLSPDIPVALVGNKNDLTRDRMLSPGDGRAMSKELGCTAFYEMSARETPDGSRLPFEDLYRHIRRAAARRSFFLQQEAVGSHAPMQSSTKRDQRTMAAFGRSSLDSHPSLMASSVSPKDGRDQAKRKQSVSRRIIQRVLGSKESHSSSKFDSDGLDSN